jgi:hypothetical protein
MATMCTLKIAFCIPFYGSWPRWFKMFCDSCAKNEKIEFLLFSDIKAPPFDIPANVKVFRLTLSDLCKKIATVLGCQYILYSGHKLCDFKAFYGLIFQEYLYGFDYWGYCDMDLVFGNIQDCLQLEKLENYDVFTAHNAYTAGHFTLLKNIERVNSLCLRINNYKDRAKIPVTTFMDEMGFYEVLERHDDIRIKMPKSFVQELDKDIGCFGLTIKSGICIDGGGLSKMTIALWDNGKAFYYAPKRGWREVIYIHFMGLKLSPFWLLCKPYQNYCVLTFTPIGVLPFRIKAWSIPLLYYIGACFDFLRSVLAKAVKKKKFLHLPRTCCVI